MSTFEVSCQIVGKVEPAMNSDNLDLVTLESFDYSFITMKNQYAPGDVVVYFPVDSVLPEWIVDALGLTGKLAKDNDGNKTRVKTIKIRGNISQGLVCKPEVLLNANKYLDKNIFKLNDFSEELGVKKYEQDCVFFNKGDLKPLPDLVFKYDIEGAQRFPSVVDYLLDKEVLITEKVEGSNWWASISPEGIELGQRNFKIDASSRKTHTWWVTYDKIFSDNILRQLQKLFGKDKRVTIRGEIVGPGIQNNYYKLDKHNIYLFEIEINGTPINSKRFLEITEDYKLNIAPVIYKGVLKAWLKEKSVIEKSDGKSLLTDRPREGIVIKPLMAEHLISGFGRVILKQRGPQYLAKES